MNKQIIFGAVAVVLVGVVGYSFMSYNPQSMEEKQPPATLGADAQSDAQQNPPIQQEAAPAAGDTVTAAELAKHNTLADCWVSVSGKVYDVTKIIPNHKNGEQAIGSRCGGDATAAFTTRGGNGPHPAESQAIIDQSYKGVLVD